MNDRHAIEVRLAIMISTIVLVFIVCNLFESLVFIFHIQEILPLDVFQNFLRPMADFLMVINSSANIVIYCSFKTEFREKFFQLYFLRRKAKKNKALPGPAEISMIPMIRAQLPKTSVELTSAASKDQQQGTVLFHQSDPNYKIVEESTPLLQVENNEEVKPMRSDSDTGYDSSIKENDSIVRDGTSLTNENNSELNQTMKKISI